MCPQKAVADVSTPVQSHHRITCLMSPHPGQFITAVNVIKEMLVDRTGPVG